jgi:transitional endoplasmic reticulum ATPase
MSVDVYLKKGEEYIEKASKAEETGELKSARDWYLKASEQLFNAASQSSGKMKTVRIENAEKLLEKARSLRVTHKEVDEAGEPEPFTVKEKSTVGFEDVAGLDNVKEEIRNKLIYPFLYPEKAELYGIRSGGGILLYGPPGTGKTYIAKAVAGEVDAVFYSIKPSEVMSKWVGESEQNVKKLFDTARLKRSYRNEGVLVQP